METNATIKLSRKELAVIIKDYLEEEGYTLRGSVDFVTQTSRDYVDRPTGGCELVRVEIDIIVPSPKKGGK